VKWRRLLWLLVLLFAGGIFAYCARERQLERSQSTWIRFAAERYGVDPMLIKAVVWRESHFNSRAVGLAQEVGLMQLREDSAQEWADAEHIIGFQHEHCFDPSTNTLAGAWYLKKLLKRYAHTDNPLPYALADYNAGRGNVLKWSTGLANTNSAAFAAQIGFPGTKHYVGSVTRRYALYRFLTRLGWD